MTQLFFCYAVHGKTAAAASPGSTWRTESACLVNCITHLQSRPPFFCLSLVCHVFPAYRSRVTYSLLPCCVLSFCLSHVWKRLFLGERSESQLCACLPFSRHVFLFLESPYGHASARLFRYLSAQSRMFLKFFLVLHHPDGSAVGLCAIHDTSKLLNDDAALGRCSATSSTTPSRCSSTTLRWSPSPGPLRLWWPLSAVFGFISFFSHIFDLPCVLWNLP